MRTWTGFMWLRVGTADGCCEHDDEPSGFMKYREFVE